MNQTATIGLAETKLAYSPEEAAQMLGISRSALYSEWQQGRGPRFVKIGRRTVVPLQAIRDYLSGLIAAQQPAI